MKFIRSNTRKEETIVWVVLYPAGSQVVQHQRGAERHSRRSHASFLGSVVKALVNAAVPLEGSEGESFSFCSSPCPNPDRSEDAQHRFILGEGKNRQGAAGCAGKTLQQDGFGGAPSDWGNKTWMELEELLLAGRGAPKGAGVAPWWDPTGLHPAKSQQNPSAPSRELKTSLRDAGEKERLRPPASHGTSGSGGAWIMAQAASALH